MAQPGPQSRLSRTTRSPVRACRNVRTTVRRVSICVVRSPLMKTDTPRPVRVAANTSVSASQRVSTSGRNGRSVMVTCGNGRPATDTRANVPTSGSAAGDVTADSHAMAPSPRRLRSHAPEVVGRRRYMGAGVSFEESSIACARETTRRHWAVEAQPARAYCKSGRRRLVDGRPSEHRCTPPFHLSAGPARSPHRDAAANAARRPAIPS